MRVTPSVSLVTGLAVLIDAVLTAAVLRILSDTPVVLGYIDPGLGALAVQLLAAALFGILFHLKRLREAAGRLMSRLWSRPRE